MMMNTTLNQLRELRLMGMLTALDEQLTQAGMSAVSFEERMALIVERELHFLRAQLRRAGHRADEDGDLDRH